MPLSGVHISCGYAGSIGPRRTGFLSVASDTAWSETFTTGTSGTTTNVGPARDTRGDAIVTISTSKDIYYAVDIDPAPSISANAATSKRRFLRANSDETVSILQGEKIAWVDA